jgi:CRISPR/Cas system-associated exonuclease Cas4 (RecB family)
MKKMILTLAIAISSLAAFAGEENVSKKVLDAFKTEFKTVKDVEWTAGSDYYKASFMYNEKYVFAYYNMDGDLLGLTRYISPVDLPLNLQIGLKNKGNDYWISDLFEVAKNETTSYYITLENADTKTVLKSTGGSDWQVFKTVKKS